VVIDPIDLVLAEMPADGLIERAARSEVAAEWFFNDEPFPAIVLAIHARLAQARGDVAVAVGSDGQVIETLAASCSFDPAQPGAKRSRPVGPRRIRGNVVEATSEFIPAARLPFLAGELAYALVHPRAELFVRHRRARNADDARVVGQAT